MTRTSEDGLVAAKHVRRFYPLTFLVKPVALMVVLVLSN
jgi:hypothetical protein